MPVLPERLHVSEPGSFAEYTLRYRLPAILHEVIACNDYPDRILERLDMLLQEIAGGPVRSFDDPGADTSFWVNAWRDYIGSTWNTLPWFWAETYFYRRILNAVEYFTSGEWYLHDPFEASKQRALQIGLVYLAQLLTAHDKPLDSWLLQSLWANRADFSNQAALANAGQVIFNGRDRLLADDSPQLCAFLLGKPGLRLGIVCDNAGPELLVDLAFANHLLSTGTAQEVVFHLKAQPLYVSDAMPKDVLVSVRALLASDNQALADLGSDLHKWLSQGSLCLRADPFWTSCLTLFEIPESLIPVLGADCVLFKGDVNYRRLLDDRHWPFSTPLTDIPNQVSVPYAALRSIKSEVVCGMPAGIVSLMYQRDRDWLTNGRWGLVQFVQLNH